MMDGSLECRTARAGQLRVQRPCHVGCRQAAHSVNVSVEGELGCLGSLRNRPCERKTATAPEGVLSHDQLLTDPNEAEDFVKKTRRQHSRRRHRTSHGAYKYAQTRRQGAGDGRIIEIHKRLPKHASRHARQLIGTQICKTRSTNCGKINNVGRAGREIQLGQERRRKINVDTTPLGDPAAIRKVLGPGQIRSSLLHEPARDAMKKCASTAMSRSASGHASRSRFDATARLAASEGDGDRKHRDRDPSIERISRSQSDAGPPTPSVAALRVLGQLITIELTP